MNNLITIISTLVIFLLGYWLGKSVSPKEDIKQKLSGLKYESSQLVKNIENRNIKPGIVQRPDAKRLYEMANPQIIEEKEAIKEALDKGIEPLTQ